MLIEPRRQWSRGAPGAGHVLDRVVAIDAGLTCLQASYEQRSRLQQLRVLVIAWVPAGHVGEAVGDEFEACALRRNQRFRQLSTEVIVNDRRAVATELVWCEPVVSRARVEATRGDVGVEPRSHRRFKVDDASRSRLIRNRGREAHVVLLTEHANSAAKRCAQLL